MTKILYLPTGRYLKFNIPKNYIRQIITLEDLYNSENLIIPKDISNFTPCKEYQNWIADPNNIILLYKWLFNMSTKCKKNITLDNSAHRNWKIINNIPEEINTIYFSELELIIEYD